MKKKILSFLCSLVMILSVPRYIGAIDFSNLSMQQRERYTQQKLEEELKNEKLAPVYLSNGGIFSGQRVQSSLIILDKTYGNLDIKNCVLEQDLIIYSKNLKNLKIENTKIKGNIYVLKTGNSNSIKLINSTTNDIIINSPTFIDEYGYSSIDNIVVTKDYDLRRYLTIRANIKKLVNYKENVNIRYYGNIDNAVANKPFTIHGNYNIKVRSADQGLYPDTVIFNLDDFSPEKGFKDLNDKTSYQDMYNYLKRSQSLGKEKLALFIKNSSTENIKQLNDALINKFTIYLPNNISGLYTTNFVIDNSIGLLYINFIYDTDSSKIEKAENILYQEYKKIKNLPAVEYVKAVNKFLATNIRYDESLKKHNIYDAMVDNLAVCEGYAKCGYYLLEKKFGKENSIIITNDDHMWNMVKINGKWYHLDFTYNDPVTEPYDKNNYQETFLFLNDKQMEKLGNRKWNKNNYPKAI